MRLYLVFEGGGAKGIVHVGALRALEAEAEVADEVEIAGVAGTSAGAIMAALVAAGYSSREMVDEGGGSPVLAAIGLADATALFGQEWRRLRFVRQFIARPPWLLGLGVLAAVLGAGWLVVESLKSGDLAYFGLGFGVLMIGFNALRLPMDGVVSLEPLARAINDALLLKISPERLAADSLVRFRDLDRPLRIVATDLRQRAVKLFSDVLTPDAPVGRAVAASACLPFMARPVEIDGSPMVDGGLVSNLPIWTFDEERALDPDAVTLAIEIAEGGGAGNAPIGPLVRVGAILRAAIFGATLLERRATVRLETVRLRTEIGLLEFDLTRATAAAAVRDAELASRAQINRRLFAAERGYDEACREVHDVFRGLLERTQEQTGRPAPGGRIRVNLAFPDPGTNKSLRIRYGYGMDGFADDDLLLPIEGSITGEAFSMREAALYAVDAHGAFPPEVGFPGLHNRHRRALIWSGMKWCLAVPIYVAAGDPKPGALPDLVFNVDSDIAIEYFGFLGMSDQENQQLIGKMAEPIREAVRRDRSP